MKWAKTNLTSARELILAAAFFFNPLGYNELFAIIMRATNSYLLTAGILYTTAIVLFAIYGILKCRSTHP